MRSPSEPPLARAVDLGLEDVDAGLGEAAHVRDLGLELDALGVHRPQLVDAVVEAVEVGGVEHAGAPIVRLIHAVCLLGARYQRPRGGALPW